MSRAVLHIPEGYELPSADELVQDARAIVQTNIALARELAPKGLGISPIWERHAGGSAVRATMLPPELATRYFSGEGLIALQKPRVLVMTAEVLPWLFDDPDGAVVALEDTHRLYCSPEAPLRPLNMPYKGHFMLLSLMLADLARKSDAKFDALEWFASYGLPLDEFRAPGDRPAAEIRAGMKERTQAMWDEEARWFERALKR